MTPKIYFFFVFLIALANVAMWIITINFINPDTSGIFGLIFFYSTLFFSLFGLIYIVSYLVHSKALQWASVYKNIQVSTRQSILFSILVVGCLILHTQKLLSWINLVVFIFILTFIEFLFISKKPHSYGRKTS